MKKYGLGLLIATSLQLGLSLDVKACTDFRLKASDGTVLITRSMEFAQDLQSNLRSSPRGREFKGLTSNNLPGLTWTSKLGYVYVDGFNLDAAFDGMNEAGLTFEFLYLPGETHYQTVPSGQDSKVIPYTMFGDWVLGNYKNIEEVKQALNDVVVTSQILPQLGNAVLPAHASIYDANGNGIVVEFYNNKINVFENIGIMTNSPKYDWQVTNLRNYLNLSPVNSQAITENGLTYAGTGQGSGAVGLPGDASPPSRFVKMSFMAQHVIPAKDATDVVNIAQHMINNVDLPAGYVRSVDNGKMSTDTTQWVVFKDVTHKVFYYRTYNDMTLRSVNLGKIDFSEKATALKMPLSMTPYSVDLTDHFMGNKVQEMKK